VTANGPDAPKPTALDTFVAAHPNVPKAFETSSTRDGFANEQHNGIDAFVFVDKSGRKQAFRYPMGAEHAVHPSAEASAKKPADVLIDELPARVAKTPVRFHLKAQMAATSERNRRPVSLR